MGCASSNPLIAGGKNLFENAKESASEVLNKGEQTMHDVGETAKDGIVSGLDTVKGAMETAVHTAENSIGGVMTKISDTFHSTNTNAHEAMDQFEGTVEDNLHNTKDTMMEAVSEAETVLASEAENAKDVVMTSVGEKVDDMKHSFGEAVHDVKEPMVDILEIEDIEQSIEMIDNTMNEVEKKTTDVLNMVPTPATTPPAVSPPKSPNKELDVKPEEPAPTLWEIAADLIVDKKETALKLMSIPIDEVLLAKEHLNSDITPEVLEETLLADDQGVTSESDDILEILNSEDTLDNLDTLENLEPSLENLEIYDVSSENLDKSNSLDHLDNAESIIVTETEK